MSGTLTDEHLDWAAQFCGIDPRDGTTSDDAANRSVDPNAGQPNQSVDPNASQTPAQPSGPWAPDIPPGQPNPYPGDDPLNPNIPPPPRPPNIPAPAPDPGGTDPATPSQATQPGDPWAPDIPPGQPNPYPGDDPLNPNIPRPPRPPNIPDPQPDPAPTDSGDSTWEKVAKVVAVLGLSVVLIPTIVAALLDPEPATKLALAGLTVVEIVALGKALGFSTPSSPDQA
jgi:hypothetical protein